MKFKREKKDTVELNQTDDQIAQNRFYKLIMFGLFVLAVVQYNTMQEIKKNQATHLIPFIGQKMVIGADYVDQSFLLEMVKNVNAFYSSATPASAKVQFSQLLPLIYPTEYDRIQEYLNRRASTLENLSSTSIFSSPIWDKPLRNKELTKHPYEILAKADDVYKVWRLTYRINRVILSNNQQPEIESISMRLDYLVENGRFWILDIKETKK